MLRLTTFVSALALSTAAMAEDIKVGVSPGEHAEIMEEVAKVAEPMGLNIDVSEFSDYVVPNQALADGDLEDCYLGVDDDPAPLHEVVDWLRERLGVTQWSEQTMTRRAGSKRCSNARARALGWVPQYSSYRNGYASIRPGKG